MFIDIYKNIYILVNKHQSWNIMYQLYRKDICEYVYNA